MEKTSVWRLEVSILLPWCGTLIRGMVLPRATAGNSKKRSQNTSRKVMPHCRRFNKYSKILNRRLKTVKLKAFRLCWHVSDSLEDVSINKKLLLPPMETQDILTMLLPSSCNVMTLTKHSSNIGRAFCVRVNYFTLSIYTSVFFLCFFYWSNSS